MLTLALTAAAIAAEPVTMKSLLAEMTDPAALARFPEYRARQASSYNRESVKRGEPGWFADSDGVGFIREETRTLRDGSTRREWVAMEQDGPGAITRMWAPYFYFDFNDRTGPTVRVYLDGAEEPALEARWIELLTNNLWGGPYGAAPERGNAFHVPAPLARFTARAGDLYLPIPFAKGCKVTFDRPPFYNIVNSRAYPAGTEVETFTVAGMKAAAPQVEAACADLLRVRPAMAEAGRWREIAPGGAWAPPAYEGAGYVRRFAVVMDPAEIAARPQVLRSTVLRMEFDGEETVWAPVGDFFGSANGLNVFTTRGRQVQEDGVMECRWVMPFEKGARLTLENLGSAPVRAGLVFEAAPWAWDARSMHFSARWRPDDVQPGDRFSDWNFVEVKGKGVLVGDQWTVLNPTRGWWGEGDEKIYVDGSWEKGFPDCFGTGTEDYYGWAGGVNPTWADVFSHPFLANIAVGSGSGAAAVAAKGGGDTRGFNICTRERGLDAVPFESRLVFDMEASPGTDQRGAKDRLGYSSVVFFYARPGATTNRAADVGAARAAVMSLESMAGR